MSKDMKIRDLKENEWVKCENEDEVRALWDWFNDNGYVRSEFDNLKNILDYFENDKNTLFCPIPQDCHYGWDFEYDKKYTNFKDLIIHDSTDTSILKVNVKVKPDSTNLSIKDLKDGQTFIMSDEDGEYLAMKTSDIDGEVYVTTFDDFYTYKNNEKYYKVVRLVSCELNEV